MALTEAQQQAISARGNVLVVAGAGTGKTSTLVERCLNCLIEGAPPASMDEILMVTFTDAAAAEMRQRIRARLEEQLQKYPGSARWQEQLALFETAHIGTLHSFCLQLIRQHFYLLELDPQLSVLREEEAWLLANEALDEILQQHYVGETPEAAAVQELIQVQGRGSDSAIQSLILHLHHYTQTLPDPEGWLREQIEAFSASEPAHWQSWLLRAITEWRQRWLLVLENNFAGNAVADQCLAALKALNDHPTRAEAAVALNKILDVCKNCPFGKKTDWLRPLEDFQDEAEFLYSLAFASDGADPLIEDWSWVRSQMLTLLRLTRQFGEQFRLSKRELGMVDFHDLEQYALRLLWDANEDRPTKMALECREKLRFVFVDEYQDINAAQDKIIQALGRELPNGNRFLVGDVKQSIYRFRLANPHIFQKYARTWCPEGNAVPSPGGTSENSPRFQAWEHVATKPTSPEGTTENDDPHGAHKTTETLVGTTIPLVENFRSREGIVDFVNSFFPFVMRPEIGGVSYDEKASLRFGAPSERQPLSNSADPTPCVELHLRIKKSESSAAHDPANPTGKNNDESMAEINDLQDADKEARLVALRLRDLKTRGHQIWDDAAKKFRAAEWSDMAILLRSPSSKAESYAKEFARLNVPLEVERGGFYDSMEILDLVSLLQLLDNPLQDLPAIAVLHSPLVGLTLNELAEVRLAAWGHFWRALLAWHENAANSQSTATYLTEHGTRITFLSKINRFLDQFNRWRKLARHVSLSRCLEAILAETHYDSWVLTQPRGALRHANVQRLLGLAQQFDQFQRQSLFRFLQFVEAQKLAETQPDVAAVSEENSVRLMSIHQSKGLEFPIVVLADLGKAFNFADLKADIILDEEYGLCPQIKPPNSPGTYPSLPYWLARQRQRGELLGEELRLMYVAMTRARDTLLLTGTISESRFEKYWNRAEFSVGRASPRVVESLFISQPSAAREDARPTALPAVEVSTFDVETVASARSYSDWLGLWFSKFAAPRDKAANQGKIGTMQWTLHSDESLMSPEPSTTSENVAQGLPPADPEILEVLRRRIEWQYPFIAATRESAKTSVSGLRRRANELWDEESASPFQPAPSGLQPSSSNHRSPSAGRQSSTDRGNAHHTFLQFVSLDRVGNATELKAEAQRLVRQKSLTAEEAELLDLNGLAKFWRSELGERIRANKDSIRRELRFTARISALEISELIGGSAHSKEAGLSNEFVIIQGVVDLAIILPKEIWLVDFKTDAMKAKELDEKIRVYEPQLKLYSRALSGIYQRPVSEAWIYFLSLGEAVKSALVGDRVGAGI